MDPFIVLEHDGHKYKSKVIEKGGKTPIWNETFEVPIDTLEDTIKVRCFDEDLLMDDFVGEKEYTIRELCPL